MKTRIYCVVENKGGHSFYVTVNGEDYYLFTQSYRDSVNRYYKNGVFFNDAIDFTKSKYDRAIKHTMQKIPVYVRYIENEYEIAIFDKTKKKHEKRKVNNTDKRICA